MGKNSIDKARDTASELPKIFNSKVRRGKTFVKKKWSNFKDYVLAQNQKADKKSAGRDRPNLAGGAIVSKRAKNGGHL